MTLETIQHELKRLSKQMQLEKNVDNILVMEAECELENLQTQYENIVKELVEYGHRIDHIRENVAQQATDKWDNTKIHDDKYKIGYVDCTNDVLKLFNEVFGE